MTTRVDGPYVRVVDDDPDARAILSRMARVAGPDVRQASDGFEALGILRQCDRKVAELVLHDLMVASVQALATSNERHTA